MEMGRSGDPEHHVELGNGERRDILKVGGDVFPALDPMLTVART